VSCTRSCFNSRLVCASSVVRGAFNTVFATLVMRVAYGPAFVTPADDEALLANLSTMTRRYLFRL